MCAPLARSTKNGSPPTPRKARTGEFTPPGIYPRAVRKSSEERVKPPQDATGFSPCQLAERFSPTLGCRGGCVSRQSPGTAWRFFGVASRSRRLAQPPLQRHSRNGSRLAVDWVGRQNK